MLLVQAGKAARAGDGLMVSASDAGTVALVIYLPYYLYRARRRVYGQGRGFSCSQPRSAPPSTPSCGLCPGRQHREIHS